MPFGAVRLQLQGPIGVAPCARSRSRSRRLKVMIDPAVQDREIGDRERKIWVELDGALVKLLAPVFSFSRSSNDALQIVRLARKRDRPRRSRSVCASSAPSRVGESWACSSLRDLLREIGLDRENVRQIAIVILRPDMLVVLGVDQLHIHPHPIARLAARFLRESRRRRAPCRFRGRFSLCRDSAMTEVREITFRSPILERFVRMSS